MRHAIRSLRRSPALAGIAIASLAVGIGGNITVYAVVRGLVLNDVSARDLHHMVRLTPDLTYPVYRELRETSPFKALAFHTGIHDTNWRAGDHSEIAWQTDTSANFFEVLGVGAAAGRLYSQADEDRLVAVVSHGFWTRRLHSDAKAVGRILQLNGRMYTLVGVLPRGYGNVMRRGVSPEIYAPVRPDLQPRCHPFARMWDGVTRAQANAAWTAVAGRLVGFEISNHGNNVKPLGGLAASVSSEGDDLSVFVFVAMLFGLAGVLVLIACSNVAGLLLARGVARQREIAIRKALGAGPWQTVRPILAESVVLVGCGCIAALAIDGFLRHLLSGFQWPNAYNIPVEFYFQSDRGLLLYALIIASAALVFSSLQPALRGWNADLGIVLKGGDRIGERAGPQIRVVSFLGVQVSLSVFLLVLASLFARSFLHIVRTDPGFDVGHTVIAAVHPFPRQRERGAWRNHLVGRIQQVPGVLGVTSTELQPLMGETEWAEVRRREGASPILDVYSKAEGEQYFTTLGIPVLRGRDFELADRDRKPTPAIINRTLARKLFGDDDPIGARLIRGRDGEETLTVVGVVADTKMRTLGEVATPALYTPDFNGQLIVRVTGNPAQWIQPLRRAITEVDADAALDIRPMRDALDGARVPMQAAASFVGSLSLVGLVLALVGLYGSVAYAVGLRTREFGIRATLGATQSTLMITGLRDGIVVATAGILAGVGSALLAIPWLVDLLPAGVNPWDPPVFLGVGVFVLITAVAAALAPARRAAIADPAVALRDG